MTTVTTSTPIRVALRGHDTTARRARTSRPAGSSPTPDGGAPTPQAPRPSVTSDPEERANGWLVAGSVLVAIALFSALALGSFATLG